MRVLVALVVNVCVAGYSEVIPNTDPGEISVLERRTEISPGSAFGEYLTRNTLLPINPVCTLTLANETLAQTTRMRMAARDESRYHIRA